MSKTCHVQDVPFSAATSLVSSPWYNCADKTWFKVGYLFTGTVNMTMVIESKDAFGNIYTVDQATYTAAGNELIAWWGAFLEVRVRVSARTNGAVTCTFEMHE